MPQHTIRNERWEGWRHHSQQIILNTAWFRPQQNQNHHFYISLVKMEYRYNNCFLRIQNKMDSFTYSWGSFYSSIIEQKRGRKYLSLSSSSSWAMDCQSVEPLTDSETGWNWFSVFLCSIKAPTDLHCQQCGFGRGQQWLISACVYGVCVFVWFKPPWGVT